MTFDFRIRTMDRTDHDFVIRTWTRSHASVQTRAAPALYQEEQPKAIEYALSHENILGLVATPAEDPLLICGWGVFEKSARVVHYVFTKSAYRRLGIARALVEKAHPGPDLRFYTHPPARVTGNCVRLPPSSWRYNGYLFI